MLITKPLGEESQDQKQGKMLLFTEYSLLSLLHVSSSVIKHAWGSIVFIKSHKM